VSHDPPSDPSGPAGAQGPLTLHATTVALAGRGLLILGPSGSGKSALALGLMAGGAGLVADDRTIITGDGPRLIAACPPAISGLIEARGLGLLRAAAHDPVPLAAAVDLGRTERDRLPEPRRIVLLDRPLPLLYAVPAGYFTAALLLYLKEGRVED
jgi:HPr kinase/phosphorylase